MQVWQIIASILSGLIVCIPLVVKLVQVTREAVREKNWNILIDRVSKLMVEAEILFDDNHNAGRKKYVLDMIEDAADTINYDLTDADKEKLSDLIDALCTMARTVNGPEGRQGK